MRQLHGGQTSDEVQVTRRRFLGTAAAAGAGIALAAEEPGKGPAAGKLPRDLPNGGKPLKIFCCDFNFSLREKPYLHQTHSAPHEWAFVDPQQYFDWHRDFGVNCMFCQAFTSNGYAFYPTKLGPLAPGPGARLLPELFERSRKIGMPFCSYFTTASDDVVHDTRPEWRVPGGPTPGPDAGWTRLLAPESPWTDLLCARISEFLRAYPVDWVCFDPFTYGMLGANNFRVPPAWFVKEPFREIIGREMPAEGAKITLEESRLYIREVLARQFHRIQAAIREASPGTKSFYNVPFYAPEEPLWVNHPMLNECDMLNTESSDELVSWLLRIRKPHQRVMTTILGRPDDQGVCDPDSWRRWYQAGCDFFGYAWAIPPDFRPHPRYAKDLEITRKAYHEMA